MFFCDDCKVKKGYPGSFFTSVGKCEICGEVKLCNEVPSSRLSKPPSKEEFVKKNEDKFRVLNKLFPDGNVRNKRHNYVSELATAAREQLGYSKGSKDVFITSVLLRQYQQMDKGPCNESVRGYYRGKISAEDKITFVSNHFVDFQSIYLKSGKAFDYPQNKDMFRKIADNAKYELGYSNTTAGVDIAEGLYRVFIKEFKEEVNV